MPKLDRERLVLSARHWAILKPLLAGHVPHAEVWAYGSRVTGRAHEGSDLDIVLRNPGWPEQPLAGVEALVEAIQDSALPMLVDVHDWAQLPEVFHQEILRAYVVLQQSADGKS